MKSFRVALFPILFLVSALMCSAQDPLRFQAQVDRLVSKQYEFPADKKRVVFAGSSSIARWKDLTSCFPRHNVINHGFGGSQFSDLIHFYDELILSRSPEILFIYEGDNDMNQGKDPALVLEQAKALVQRIRNDLPQTRIILISPKPCIANWDKRTSYLALNEKLKHYCEATEKLEFADVWTAMVDANGIVLQDIFVSDGDHMNKKGYDLWIEVLRKFL